MLRTDITQLQEVELENQKILNQLLTSGGEKAQGHIYEKR